MTEEKTKRARQTAVWLRKLADRYERIASGEIKEGSKEVVETRLLVKLLKRILHEDWL